MCYIYKKLNRCNLIYAANLNCCIIIEFRAANAKKYIFKGITAPQNKLEKNPIEKKKKWNFDENPDGFDELGLTRSIKRGSVSLERAPLPFTSSSHRSLLVALGGASGKGMEVGAPGIWQRLGFWRQKGWGFRKDLVEIIIA